MQPVDPDETILLRCSKCGGKVTGEEVSSGGRCICSSCLKTATRSGDPPPEVEEARQEPKNRLGKYILAGLLGRGGTGVVYKAWDDTLRRWVALKILDREDEEEEDRIRFQREAQTAASLDHPGIVGIHEVGRAEGKDYIALEYIEGKTLSQADLPLRPAIQVVLEVTEAVAFAHANGIVHRDLKPHNIMIDPKGRGRVMDFGIAKRLEGEEALTLSGVIMGTPSYMSPEQAEGSLWNVDHRADIYSLGAVLYSVVCGHPPFQADTPLGTIRKVVNDEVAAPSQVRPNVPRELETIILKCLEKKPDRRYADADLLAADLRRWILGESILTRRVPVLVRIGRKAKRFRMAGLLFVLLLAVAGGGLWFALRPSENVPEPGADLRPEARPWFDAGRLKVDRAIRNLYRDGADLGARVELVREAIGELDRAIEIDPGYVEALLLRGRAWMDLHEPRKAFEDFSRVIRLQSGSPDAHYERAKAGLMIVQELREDARTRSRVSPELEKVKAAAANDFRKYHSSADPDRERVLYVKALLEYLGQRLESAFEMTSRLVAMGTNNEEVWFLRGLISWGLAREGELARYADAKKEFSEAIRKRVNYFDAYNSRGNMLAEQGDLEGAILDFTRSTRINPSFADAHANLGTCLVSLGRTAEGIPFLEEALRIREDHVQAMVNLGLAYKVQKNYEKALELVDRGLELAPEYANGFSIRGTVRRAAGDLPGAIRDYTEAIRLLPENPIAYVNRATVHGDLKDWESARADNDRFLARSRGGDLHWFDVHYNQGIFCYRLGEDRKALRYLEVAATDPRLREKALGWILRLKKRLGE